MKKFFFYMFLFASSLFAKVDGEYAVNIVGMSMDYKEYEAGTLLDSESSNYTDLTGVAINYKYNFKRQDEDDYDIVSLNMMALDGTTTYKGSVIGLKSEYGSVMSVTLDKIYDIAIDFGHIYQQTQVFGIGLSLGFGYKFWRRELLVDEVEDYEWFSLRPAIMFKYNYNSFTFSPQFEYQYGLKPTLHVTGINAVFTMGAANIFEFSLPIEYALSQKITLCGAYTFGYQKLEQSDILYDASGAAYFEPQSRAYNKYIKFGIAFKY